MEEFNKYQLKGDYHWKEYEQDTVYHQHANKVKDWVKGDNILDIGAGDGLITYLIGAKGIDINEFGIKEAKKHGIEVEHRSAYDLEGSYDAVFMGDVLEHLREPEKALEQIKNVLKGRFYLVVPEKAGKLPKYHYQEWTEKELIKIVEDKGFELQSIEVANKRIYAKFII